MSHRLRLPIVPGDDADGDGIADILEGEWARRYAPLVILEGRDWTRPASVAWLSEKMGLQGSETAFDPTRLVRGIPDHLRSGSSSPSDWTTYVHVYPRPYRGFQLQYWFFYPYNDGPLFFDHDCDWEHVTVELDGAGMAEAVYFAEHENHNPGHRRAFSDVQKEGEHPVVFSARGTHASYPDRDSTPWFDSVSRCVVPTGCKDPVWRTWEVGQLENLGERSRPTVSLAVLTYDGPWGRRRVLPGRSAPVGPLHHPGFCHDATANCTAPLGPGAPPPSTPSIWAHSPASRTKTEAAAFETKD